MEKLKELIRKHEGLRLIPYKDSEGYLTVGYGHKIEGGKITLELAEKLLEMDLYRVSLDFLKLDPVFIRNLSQVRKRVVMDMLYNLGAPRFRTFKKFIAAVVEKDFATAAVEMLDSKWHRQVGQRAVGLAEMMRHGREEE